MKALYNHDWHQCSRCGCTYPLRALNAGLEKDLILDLTSTVYSCKDPKQCEEFKDVRAAELAADARRFAAEALERFRVEQLAKNGEQLVAEKTERGVYNAGRRKR